MRSSPCCNKKSRFCETVTFVAISLGAYHLSLLPLPANFPPSRSPNRNQPGEIIFYESASVIHGRPEAFQGDRFANIFVHFAPVKGWHITANDVEMAARSGAYKKSREAQARLAEAEANTA